MTWDSPLGLSQGFSQGTARAAPFWSSESAFKLLWTSSSIGLRFQDSTPCAFRTESPIFLLVVA